MSETYRRLILDPRALKPRSQGIERSIYSDAISAINEAKKIVHVDSEVEVLEKLLAEVKRNRCGYYD